MKRILFLFTALWIFSFSGCTSGTKDYTFFAMDTLITLRLPGGAEEDFLRIEEIAGEIENSLSRTRTGGDTARVNESTGGVPDAGPHLQAVLQISLQIAEETNGAFSPAMGTLTDLWNVNGGGPVPESALIEAAKMHTDYRLFSLAGAAIVKNDSAAKLDFGAVGKGYAAQQMTEYLQTRYEWGLLSLGGNVAVFGEKPDGSPFKIGITDPFNTGDVLGYLQIDSGFVSVSGGYERYFEENGVRYHHILDAADGFPADSGLASVAVWSQNGARADALSTALFVMGPEKTMEYYGEYPGEFEAVLITADNEILLTPGLTWGEQFLPTGEWDQKP